MYNVFNIDQTNMKEARPEMYEKFVADCEGAKAMRTDEMFSFEPMDKMIAENLWICPIVPTHGDDAYYSISKNSICFPLKEQFISGEAYYSNLFHECAHSTGAEQHLNRLKPTSFGSAVAISLCDGSVSLRFILRMPRGAANISDGVNILSPKYQRLGYKARNSDYLL